MTTRALPPLSLKEFRYFLRRDLMSFAQAAFYYLNPGAVFMPAPHLELIAAKLEACARGEIKRLIINLPPRSLKSHMISVCFPAFLLGLHPAIRIVCASYGQELAEKFARDHRKLMSSPLFQVLFKTRFSERVAVHDFETEEGGGRFTASVGGAITGRGGDFIILDDPLKPDEALSETQRSSVNKWFDGTLMSRLNNKFTGCIIIVMQRLHQDDLVGHVLELGDWEVLSFPAIAESDVEYSFETAFGTRKFARKAGEALHPAREPVEMLRAIEKQIGEYNFAAQYQQRPDPPGGAIIKKAWLKYYAVGSEPAKFEYVVQSWDTANKSGELNDYSVCTTWGVFKDRYYLLHVFRKRLNFPDLKRAVEDMSRMYKPHKILIEDKASGTQLIQDLSRAGFRVEAYQPPAGADKVMRLHSQSIGFENGLVLLPYEALWLDDYVREITTFPGSKNDDQVDSTTQFLDHMRTRPQPMRIDPKVLEALKRMPPRRRYYGQ